MNDGWMRIQKMKNNPARMEFISLRPNSKVIYYSKALIKSYFGDSLAVLINVHQKSRQLSLIPVNYHEDAFTVTPNKNQKGELKGGATSRCAALFEDSNGILPHKTTSYHVKWDPQMSWLMIDLVHGKTKEAHRSTK